MDALDKVRREAWREAHAKAKALKSTNPRGKGRPRKDDASSKEASEAKSTADEIKNSAYALGKAPENLTEIQQLKLEMIANSNPRLYRAYLMKEQLRLLLKIKDPAESPLFLSFLESK